MDTPILFISGHYLTPAEAWAMEAQIVADDPDAPGMTAWTSDKFGVRTALYCISTPPTAPAGSLTPPAYAHRL